MGGSARWCVPEPHELLDPNQQADDVYELHDRTSITMSDDQRLHAHDSEPLVLPPESYHSDGLVKRANFSYTTVAIKNGFRFV